MIAPPPARTCLQEVPARQSTSVIPKLSTSFPSFHHRLLFWGEPFFPNAEILSFLLSVFALYSLTMNGHGNGQKKEGSTLSRWLRTIPLYHTIASTPAARKISSKLSGKTSQRYGLFVLLLLAATWAMMPESPKRMDLDFDDDESTLDFGRMERDFWPEKPKEEKIQDPQDDGGIDVLYLQAIPNVADTLELPDYYFENLWNRTSTACEAPSIPIYQLIPQLIVSTVKALLKMCVWPAKLLLKALFYLIVYMIRIATFPFRALLYLVGVIESPTIYTNVDAYADTVLGWRAHVGTAGSTVWNRWSWKIQHSTKFSIDDNPMAVGILPNNLHLGVGPVDNVKDARTTAKPYHLMLDKTRDMAKHAWRSYYRSARGCDELAPITSACRNWYHADHSLLLTPHESLDTLYLLGLFSEFKQAKSLVMDVEWYELDVDVEVKELVRACLGGLLSAYAVSSDVQFLEKAIELGSRLLVAYGVVGPDATSSFPGDGLSIPARAFPSPFINLKKSTASNPFDELPLADVLDFQSEFETLSRLSGDARWSKAVKRVEKWLWLLGSGVAPIKAIAKPGPMGIGNGYLPHLPGLWPSALVVDASPQAEVRRQQNTAVPITKVKEGADGVAKPDPDYLEWAPRTPFVVPRFYGVKDWSAPTYASICRRAITERGMGKMSILCADSVHAIFKYLGIQDFVTESPLAPYTSSFSPSSSTAALLRDMIRDPTVKAEVTKQILDALTRVESEDSDQESYAKKPEAQVVAEMAQHTDVGQLTKRSMRVVRFLTRFSPPDFPILFQEYGPSPLDDENTLRRDWEADPESGIDQVACSLVGTLAQFMASKRSDLVANTTDVQLAKEQWRAAWGWIDGLAETCARVWTEAGTFQCLLKTDLFLDFGLAPKEAEVSDIHPRSVNVPLASRNALLFSTIDSLYHMHAVTLNPSYRAWAGQILEALDVFARIPGTNQRAKLVNVDGGGIGGYSGVENVISPDHVSRNEFDMAAKITTPLTYTDHQPSYFVGATVKYLALIFAGNHGEGLHTRDFIRNANGRRLQLTLDDFVFNSRTLPANLKLTCTGGHLLPIYPEQARVDVTKVISKLRERESGKKGDEEW
jgi:hypothetical protein